MDDERKLIPVGTRVVVRDKRAEGVILRIASNGKWSNIIMHEVRYGLFGRTSWFEAYDLLVLEPPHADHR
jgi:hypothetical protein